MTGEAAARMMSRAERDAFAVDIGDVNTGVLDAITDPELAMWVTREWGLVAGTRSAVRSMAGRTRACVVNSGVPLFRLAVPDDPAPAAQERVPTPVARLQFRALASAQRAGLVAPVATATLFRARLEAVERLSGWSVRVMERVASFDPRVLRVRRPRAPTFWHQLDTGGRAGEEVGGHLIRALGLMGTE